MSMGFENRLASPVFCKKYTLNLLQIWESHGHSLIQMQKFTHALIFEENKNIVQRKPKRENLNLLILPLMIYTNQHSNLA